MHKVKVKCAIAAVSLIVGAGPAFAGGPTRGEATVIDPGTGLEVRMAHLPDGTVTFEIGDGRVSIGKAVSLGRSLTTVRSGAEQLAIEITRDAVSVRGRKGVVTVPLARPERVSEVLSVLRASEAASQARALLARVTLGPGTLAGHALLLTRSWLQDAAGEAAGHEMLVSFFGNAAKGVHAVPVMEGKSPSYCWDEYTAAANRATAEYMDCYYSTRWWQIIARGECGALYDIEAEGAWLWYLNCVGVPF